MLYVCRAIARATVDSWWYHTMFFFYIGMVSLLCKHSDFCLSFSSTIPGVVKFVKSKCDFHIQPRSALIIIWKKDRISFFVLHFCSVHQLKRLRRNSPCMHGNKSVKALNEIHCTSRCYKSLIGDYKFSSACHEGYLKKTSGKHQYIVAVTLSM